MSHEHGSREENPRFTLGVKKLTIKKSQFKINVSKEKTDSGDEDQGADGEELQSPTATLPIANMKTARDRNYFGSAETLAAFTKPGMKQTSTGMQTTKQNADLREVKVMDVQLVPRMSSKLLDEEAPPETVQSLREEILGLNNLLRVGKAGIAKVKCETPQEIIERVFKQQREMLHQEINQAKWQLEELRKISQNRGQHGTQIVVDIEAKQRANYIKTVNSLGIQSDIDHSNFLESRHNRPDEALIVMPRAIVNNDIPAEFLI